MQKMRNVQDFSQEKGQFENIASGCEDEIPTDLAGTRWQGLNLIQRLVACRNSCEQNNELRFYRLQTI